MPLETIHGQVDAILTVIDLLQQQCCSVFHRIFFKFEISKNSTYQYKNKPKATYTQTIIVQNEYSENELDTNESRNTTRCQSCNVWINLDGSYVDNPVVSGRTVIITFPKVIIPVTLVALFFLGSWFNSAKVQLQNRHLL